MVQRVPFMVAELGDADPFMHLHAALAEKERRLIVGMDEGGTTGKESYGTKIWGIRRTWIR